jgi:Flp pilus assembly pilin Flp
MQLRILTSWLTARLGVRDERGANLVEYVMLLCFIAVVVVAAIIVFGGGLAARWQDAADRPEFN